MSSIKCTLDKKIFILYYKKQETPETEPEILQCPRFEKCISHCYHAKPHEKTRHCNTNGECPGCVPEIEADVTFFEDDFEL